MTGEDGEQLHIVNVDSRGDEGDGDVSLSVGQKSVMTAICWMVTAARRNATRRRASTVMVSESHSLQCGNQHISGPSWVHTHTHTHTHKNKSMLSSGVSFRTMATPYKVLV